MSTSTITRREEIFGLNEAATMAGESPQARRERVRQDPRMRTAVVEANRIYESARSGDRRSLMNLNEAIVANDLFRSALGEVLDRELIAQYEDIETQWTKISTRTTLKDFKPKTLVELTRNRHRLRKVPERTPYPVASTGVTERQISVAKFGEQFGYTFEARINDDIGELEQVPNGWATQVRYTEDDETLELLANPLTGAPNTAFFNVGNGNLGTGILNAANLQEAITFVTTKRDKDGRILRAGQLQLVVGPALQFTAELVMNTEEIEFTEGNQKVKIRNPFRGKVALTVMEHLPGTAWFVIPVPSAPRPAFYTGFLRGHETPDMRVKNDQGTRVGGGAIGPEDGSFDEDTIWYRVRAIVGAAHGDPEFTYASDGEAA